MVILTVILSIELGFKGTSGYPKQLYGTIYGIPNGIGLKNDSMKGFIKNELLNEILDRIDSHKGKRAKITLFFITPYLFIYE